MHSPSTHETLLPEQFLACFAQRGFLRSKPSPSRQRRAATLGGALSSPGRRRNLRAHPAAETMLVFVNTRSHSQAESIFQELWRINDDALARSTTGRSTWWD